MPFSLFGRLTLHSFTVIGCYLHGNYIKELGTKVSKKNETTKKYSQIMDLYDLLPSLLYLTKFHYSNRSPVFATLVECRAAIFFVITFKSQRTLVCFPNTKVGKVF